jgi:hypothetical protein
MSREIMSARIPVKINIKWSQYQISHGHNFVNKLNFEINFNRILLSTKTGLRIRKGSFFSFFLDKILKYLESY